MRKQKIKEVQKKILEIMKFVDRICRENDITYYIMGGTALGAVRHGGFIPWDDDLDIFMTPENYKKFKSVFNKFKAEKFILQEWKIVDNFLEYAKVRMNGTTFIEESFIKCKDMHHGIYIDIMILHKCPKNIFLQKIVYYASKYVTLVALSRRNWKPKNRLQKLCLSILKMIPDIFLAKQCYKLIYQYDDLKSNFDYCYFITKANFKQGVFDKSVFAEPIDIEFEDIILMGPTKIKKYLKQRYGDYMKMPSKEQREMDVHAKIYDTEVSYNEYL